MDRLGVMPHWVLNCSPSSPALQELTGVQQVLTHRPEGTQQWLSLQILWRLCLQPTIPHALLPAPSHSFGARQVVGLDQPLGRQDGMSTRKHQQSHGTRIEMANIERPDNHPYGKECERLIKRPHVQPAAAQACSRGLQQPTSHHQWERPALSACLPNMPWFSPSCCGTETVNHQMGDH